VTPQKLTLSGFKLPSANVLRRQYRNRFAYKKLRTMVEWMVRAQALKFPELAEKAKKHRAVTITRCFDKHERAYDPDNLVAGVKPILDALVKEKLLRDDSSKWLSLNVEQRRADVRRVEVLIEELQ
jgi:Holliday junction resolvase RusA-like endonuclease